MQPRQGSKNRAKPKPNRQHHGREAKNNPKHMRHRATKAEIGAGSREHGVVRPGRATCGQGETKQRPEKRIMHSGSP
jgi:hypothetical protein